LVWFTQILFYGLPWLQWNDRQAVLFHLGERKFYLFGLVLWPQDVFYLALLLIISAYALFLFTAIAGRSVLWLCLSADGVHRNFHVDREQDRRRSFGSHETRQGPMTAASSKAQGLKHAIWILIALWSGFTLVAYFTPVSELLAEFPFNLSGWELFWTFFYAGFFYMQAGFLREQVCKYMCPMLVSRA
jgi:polyferredoxin